MFKLNYAIVGCGRISINHINAAVNAKEKINLVALCDIEGPKIIKGKSLYEIAKYNKSSSDQQFAEHCGLSSYLYYKEMLARESVDLVAICTESGHHAEIAIACMNHGKHVIVEKPMALSVEDAKHMIDAAKENNVKLCISHQNRFNPAIRKLREALEQGRFGRLIAGNARILWNRDQSYYAQAPWRGTFELDGGCLMNQCIHNIDLLQWMLGEQVEWVHAEVKNFIHPYIEAEDYGTIQIKFANGAIGNVEGTVCVYPQNLEETLTILGEKGTVSIGGLAVNQIETWQFADGLDSEEEVKRECNEEVSSVYGNGHVALYEDMIAAIEQDRQPLINGESGKTAMEIILAAYQSTKEQRRVSFPLDAIACREFK